MLVCSNVATATVDSDEVSADQLRRLGDLAAEYDIRVAFEALAWGRFVDDYRRAWRIVELADHPHVGVCLDSFHVLSRGHDPAAIEDIPADKIFFLQLADAPALTHGRAVVEPPPPAVPRRGRLRPGRLRRRTCWPPATTGRCRWRSSTTPSGRPTPTAPRCTPCVRCSGCRTRPRAQQPEGWRRDLAALTAAKPPTGFDFVEIKAEDTSDVEVLLGQLGFTPRGRHRTKPVSLWVGGRCAGGAQRAAGPRPGAARRRRRAAGARRGATSRRAAELMAPVGLPPDLRRRAGPRRGRRPRRHRDVLGHRPARLGGWVDEFENGLPAAPTPVRGIDHVNLAQPWQTFDDAVLFFTSVFGLSADAPAEVPGPTGLVRSQ